MKNNYFCHYDLEGIGFGSEEKFGLFILKDLKEGYTFGCRTFQNQRLSRNNRFYVRGLEMWGFEPEDFY